MARSYCEELVYWTAEDGVVLTGVVIQPIEGASQPARIVWIHGNTGTFYSLGSDRTGRVTVTLVPRSGPVSSCTSPWL
jgi:hypothetical protein